MKQGIAYTRNSSDLHIVNNRCTECTDIEEPYRNRQQAWETLSGRTEDRGKSRYQGEKAGGGVLFGRIAFLSNLKNTLEIAVGLVNI